MVSFYLKPRRRLWDPEGIETLIEITAPKTYEDSRTKNLSQGEAEQRLSYLANIVDSGGWAIRGVNAAPNMSINNDVFLEAQGAVDVLDAHTSIAQSFNQMMSETSARTKQEAVERMKATMFAPTPPPATPMQTQMASIVMPEYNPYPTDIQQTVIQPLNDPSHMAEQNIEQVPVAPIKPPQVAPVIATPVPKTQVSTSDTPIPADIINLVNNDDVSIATLQSMGDQIHKKLEEASDEVFVSLR
jgi:hypothetical protein